MEVLLFFLTYIIVLFTFGLSFMMPEFVVGRYYKMSLWKYEKNTEEVQIRWNSHSWNYILNI